MNFWIYSSPVETHKVACSLVLFGAEILKRAKVVKEIDMLEDIYYGLGCGRIHPDSLIISEFFFEYLIDSIKILIFFENYMKAELMMKGTCVHKLNGGIPAFTKLAKEQYKRPIRLDEIDKIQPFQIEEDRSYAA